MAKLADALTEAYAVAPAGAVVIDTLEVSIGSDHLFCTNSFENVVATLETGVQVTFIPMPFTVKLPEKSTDGLPTLDIVIDNVNHLVSDFIQKALATSDTLVVKYRPYMANDLSAPQMVPPMTFHIADAKITATEVSAAATFPDIVNKKFPNEMYNLRIFPGLRG